jgi:hypothetical protein
MANSLNFLNKPAPAKQQPIGPAAQAQHRRAKSVS